MRKAGNILLLLLLLTLVLPACKKDAKTAVATGVDAKVMPTMMTRDVKTLISDSGMTRYRITSKLWLVYDEVKDPYWKFPYELYIEKFDTLFNVEAYIRSDSATYFKDKQLGRKCGNPECEKGTVPYGADFLVAKRPQGLFRFIYPHREGRPYH